MRRRRQSMIELSMFFRVSVIALSFVCASLEALNGVAQERFHLVPALAERTIEDACLP